MEGKGRDKEEYIGKVSTETLPLSSVGPNSFSNPTKSEEPEPNSKKITKADSKVLELFDYWRSVMQHPRAKLDKNRETKINKALMLGYTLEQLKQAIDGCANTPFNMGKNNQNKRYDDIGLIYRDADHIERFTQNSLNENSVSAIQLIKDLSEGAI